MPVITSIEASETLDSRGNPTVQVSCGLQSGASAKASVPSGASTGAHEALELRDKDPDRYGGLGVLKAVANVNAEIRRAVTGKEFDQASLDKSLIALDGTENKSRLGANAILGVSLAFARAAAAERKVQLYEYVGNLAGNSHFAVPDPMLNIINGGKHADSGLDIQEFMIVPSGFDDFHAKMEAAAGVIASLKNTLENRGYGTEMGDEGGYAPKLIRNEEALDIMEEAIKAAGYDLDKIKFALDAAASSFYKDSVYRLKIDGEAKALNGVDMISWYKQLAESHSIVSIEDGLAEDDWDGFAAMTRALGGSILIVGDDLTVTNAKRIMKAAEKRAINAVLIKPNQIGTLSETIEAVRLTKEKGWTAIASHRSGETMDTFIADLAVGLGCSYIKSGSLTKPERSCKYERLAEIEEAIDKH